MVRMKIGLDFDDCIAPFNSIAIHMANEEYGLNLELEDITSWVNDGDASVIKEFYNDSRLYNMQTARVKEEVIKSVRQLMKYADVYFISAVSPQFMETRVNQIQTLFPELGVDRIILGQAKYLVHFDIILDDNIDNILDSPAEYPVLMRKPWNSQMTGLLSVNSVSEFVLLVEHILDNTRNRDLKLTEPTVIALVGPSGSGKNIIATKLCEAGAFRPQNYTDNPNKRDCYYVFVAEYDSEKYIETTMYAGYHYGTKEFEIDTLLKNGKNVVIPLDMCGAIGMKSRFPTAIVYIDNDKQSVIESILSSNLDNNEKTLRLLSIDAEKKNKSIADFVINNRDGEGASRILALFN